MHAKGVHRGIVETSGTQDTSEDEFAKEFSLPVTPKTYELGQQLMKESEDTLESIYKQSSIQCLWINSL